MSIYLGTFGEVELKRQFDGGVIRSTINPSDVNVAKKRFSFEFEHGQLITGDQVQIFSDDGTTLDFISGYTKKGIKKYIYVDELDGIRLYSSFADATAGEESNAIALAKPSEDQPIRIVVKNTDYRVLGRVQSYELNTQRDTVDTTTLSDDFRSRISTIMSGSGRMACEWEYTGDSERELPHYLLELLLRTKVGSSFRGKFYIKTANYNPANHAGGSDDTIWYEFDGVLTSCAVQFTPGQMVQITADFITTSTIQIRMNLEDRFKLLQEDSDDILLEQGTNVALNVEQA